MVSFALSTGSLVPVPTTTVGVALLQQGLVVPIMVGALAVAFTVSSHRLCALRSGRFSKGLFVHGGTEVINSASR